MNFVKELTLIGVLLVFVQGDTYLHYPRGSNNRLRENSANRNNGNRVFDSQNNNRGGYNVGIKEADKSGQKENEQHPEQYMASDGNGKTIIPVRWTSQHGSGGDEDTNPTKLNSNFVIQVMCKDEEKITTNDNDRNFDVVNRMRDGTSQSTQNYQRPGNQRNTRDRNTGVTHIQFHESEASFKNRRRNSVRQDRVLQEPLEWHDKCYAKPRNKGLFTADQNVRNDKGATSTRQNPNGNRRGYECPEERDYYPYWAPTPWVDVMVYSQNASMCNYYTTESFNVKSKWECVEYWEQNKGKGFRHYTVYDNKDECITSGGQWLEFHQHLEIMEDVTNEAQCKAKKSTGSKFLWARPINLEGSIEKRCLVVPAAPECKPYPFGRVNHLGNGADLEEIGYDWVVPNFPSGKPKDCVLRTRYNISTDDYDGWSINAKSNKENSPIINDPEVHFGAQKEMQLAINTAQFGRTFQDRTHKFRVYPRPAAIQGKNIKVLSVQGKRGNIVQTFPAVEYDFVPRNLKTTREELVHVMWTGSNTHNNQNPGGDGQTGDAGEGKGGTDRSNMLGMLNRLDNWPLPDNHENSFVKNMEPVWSAYDLSGANPPTAEDLTIQLATSGYFKSLDQVDSSMNNKLDNAPPTFIGAIFRMKKKGDFHYMCTRNNNFSNRSQKGTIVVE